MYRRALEIMEVPGVEHPNTLASVSNLGSLLERQGNNQEAEAIHRRALEVMEKVLGVEHPDTVGNVNNVVLVLSKQGKYEVETMLEIMEVLRVEHSVTLNSVNNFGSVLASQGDKKRRKRCIDEI